MSLPTSVVITGCDSMRVLDQALAAAESFRPLSADQICVAARKDRPLRGARSVRALQDE